jgi:hypothetical protein
MNKNKLKIVLGGILMAMGFNANAGSASPDITVNGTMIASCEFSAGNAFTATGNGLSVTKSSHTLGITCDNGLAYTVSQASDVFVSGAYAFLYRDASFTQKLNPNYITGTGNTTEQTYPIYVLWASNATGTTPISASKSGTIGVQVTF